MYDGPKVALKARLSEAGFEFNKLGAWTMGNGQWGNEQGEAHIADWHAWQI
jgi:hypothetical protein